MDFIARHNPTRIATGAEAPARINQAEELVQIPWFTQLCLEGRIFVAGHGIEEAGVDSEATLDDQKPSVALSAPLGGTIVIPLYFRAYFDTDGGAAPSVLYAYVQADKGIAGSGTAVTSLSCLGGVSPRRAQAVFQNSLSSITASVAAENVVVSERTHLIAAMIGTEAATTVQGVEVFAPDGGGTGSSFEFIWKPDGIPVTLKGGSSMLFYAHTGSGDSKYNYTMAWAELDEDDYRV